MPSAADGKEHPAFAVRRMTSAGRHCGTSLCPLPLYAKPLSSAAVGKLAKWVSSQGAQVAAAWLLCRPRRTAKAPLPSAADGKGASFFCFFLIQQFSQQIYDIYIYFTGLCNSKHMTYPAHKFHHAYIYSSIHSYIASCTYTLFHPYILQCKVSSR